MTDDDTLTIATELDSVHCRYMTDLMHKLKTEMDAMKEFRSVIKRARACNNIISTSTPSNEQNPSPQQNTAPTATPPPPSVLSHAAPPSAGSQSTEITEDEVLRYFEMIYNFLDDVDENNSRLRRALDRIGRATDSAGRPYSRERGG